MKKRNLIMQKSPAVSGSISKHYSIKVTQCVALQNSFIAAIPISSMRLKRTALMESTIHAKQITKHMSEGSMPSIKACELCRTLSYKTLWKIICMPIIPHGPLKEDYPNMTVIFPMLPRTPSTVISRVPMDGELRHTGCKNVRSARNQGLPASPGRIESLLIKDQAKSTSVRRLDMPRETSLSQANQEEVSSWLWLIASFASPSWSKLSSRQYPQSQERVRALRKGIRNGKP